MLSFKNYIFEANLAGSTVNYSQKTGAFYKYVEMADDPGKDYEADRDATLLDMQGIKTDLKISKGEKFKILDRKEKDFWVRWTSKYDDYDGDWTTTLDKRPVFKEDNWKSESEKEIRRLKNQGFSDKQIAEKLPDACVIFPLDIQLTKLSANIFSS